MTAEHEKVIIGKRKVACKCGEEGVYSEKWDAFLCPKGMIWLDDECSCDELECEFRNRPATPNAVDLEKFLDEEYEYNYVP